MASERLPWEVVETFPSTDAALLAKWNTRVDQASTTADRARSLIGRSLVSYWAVQEAVTDGTQKEADELRSSDVVTALQIARGSASPNLLAEALLGSLYALWGPEAIGDRAPIVRELADLRPKVTDEELRLRILEWIVLEHLDRAELDQAGDVIEQFADETADTELILFRRREILWRGCVAMLSGRIDESLSANQEAISSTANTAGSPFSFQNVAITMAIERYFRRGLGDVIDSIRSIRASSPRVAPNWDTGLAFALSEAGELSEATQIFTELAADDFLVVPRDLNWLVTMQLLGLIAITLGDTERGSVVFNALRPFATFDATHGSGYASYGPVARVVGSLAALKGDQKEAEHWFDFVLSTRQPGPWTSLSRLNRAQSRRNSDPVGALDDATTADTELQRFGLDGWASIAARLAAELRLDGHGDPIARLNEGHWTFRHHSGTASVDAGVGVEHLVKLLAGPGELIDVLQLESLTEVPPTASSESSLDHSARAAYRSRVGVLESRPSRSRSEEDELSYLLRELSGSAHYASTSPEIERARVRVTKAIRRSIEEIAAQSSTLGNHLRESIDTGRRCLYRPGDGRPWLIVRHSD